MITVQRFFSILLVSLLVLVIAIFWQGPPLLEKSMNSVLPHATYPISQQARQLHQKLIIGDWHADSLLWNRDLNKHHKYGHVDFPRLQQGNVALQMFTTVTKSPDDLNYHDNAADAPDNITNLLILQRWPLATWSSLTARAQHQAHRLKQMIAAAPENIMLITSQQDVSDFLAKRAASPKLIGALLGTEGSHALDGDLKSIQLLFDQGFRMMSLQHFFDNKLGGSLHGLSSAGLTAFGRQAVEAMQARNIIVDLSHSSEQTVEDVLNITKKPLIISHTGFKGHCDTPRNINDSLMIRIAETDGLVAVGYWSEAVCGSSPQDIADAIIYGITIIGEDHIALGSDFDGAVETALDSSELIAITQALLDKGLEERAIFKVMGGNMLLFLQNNLPSQRDNSNATTPSVTEQTLTQD